MIGEPPDRERDETRVLRCRVLTKSDDRGLCAIGLAPDERDAVLVVLDDQPASLAELRGKLAHGPHIRMRE